MQSDRRAGGFLVATVLLSLVGVGALAHSSCGPGSDSIGILPEFPPPPPPTGLHVSAAGVGFIEWAWDASRSLRLAYDVQSRIGGTWGRIVRVDVPPYRQQAAPGTTIWLQVRAVYVRDAFTGEPLPGAWSQPVAGTTRTELPRVCEDGRSCLAAFYRATDGANWTNNTAWLTSAPLMDWFGVATDDNGRVSGIELSENGLSGTLPAALGQLTGLTRLSLHGNRLSGSIPGEFARLTNLEVLSLGRNELHGSIPGSLGELTNLTALYLENNRFSGSIPPELGQLTNLTVLYLAENGLSGSIPSEFGRLVNLELLWLGDNQLSGPIPPALGQLASLERLWLDDNLLSGAIPPELGRLTNLELLSLGGNRLSGAIPAELGNLTSLRWLVLDRTELTGRLPDTFTSLVSLEELRLGSGVCVPANEAFASWLAGIEDKSDIRTCANTGSRAALAALYRGTGGADRESDTAWLIRSPRAWNCSRMHHVGLSAICQRSGARLP